MSEKQPTTEHNAAEQQDKLREQWDSSELPARAPVTVSAEHTTEAAPEVAAFHLGGKDSLEDRQKKGALYQVVDTSKLKRLGNYYQYEGYFFDASQGGDYLIVSSTNDGSETRRGNADAKPENFSYQFVSKGGQLDVGRTANSELTPDHDAISRQHLQLDVDDDGNISFIDLDSTNGTTLHTPEAAAVITGERIEDLPPDDEAIDVDFDPSSAIDAEPDAEVRHSDAELLGQRYRVLRTIKAAGNQRMRAVEAAQATWKNTLDTPKKMRLALRTSLAEGRVARHQKKVDAASEGTWKHQRHLKRLQKVAAKRDAIKNQYDSHTGRMKDRRTSVKDNFERRHTDTIKNLKDRAELSRSHKALRHELKEQGAGFVERRLIVRDAIKNHPKVVLEALGDTSNIANLRAREFKHAERTATKEKQKQSQINTMITNTRERAASHRAQADEAERRIAAIPDEITKVQEAADAIREQLADLDPKDTSRRALSLDLQNAEAIQQQLANEQDQLQHMAHRLRLEAGQLDTDRAHLEVRLTAQEQVVESARQEMTRRKQVLDDAQRTRQEAIHNAVNTQLDTKEKK